MRKDALYGSTILVPRASFPHVERGFFHMSASRKPAARKAASEKNYVYRTVVMALFCALAYATMFVFRFNVAFLTFDLKDVFLTIGGLLFGPIAAVVMSLLVALLEFITVGDTGPYGFLMNFVSSAVFTSVCALVYGYRKKLSSAVIGLVAAVISMTGVMMLMNLIVTPLYTSSSSADVAKMIPTLLLPFNLTKAVFNAAFVLLLYKPVSRALKAAGFTPSSARSSAKAADQPTAETRKSTNTKNTLLAIGISVLLLIAAVLVFVVVLHGKMEWLHNPFADFITK